MNILLFFYDYLSKYRLGMKNHFSPSIIYHIGPVEKTNRNTVPADLLWEKNTVLTEKTSWKRRIIREANIVSCKHTTKRISWWICAADRTKPMILILILGRHTSTNQDMLISQLATVMMTDSIVCPRPFIGTIKRRNIYKISIISNLLHMLHASIRHPDDYTSMETDSSWR